MKAERQIQQEDLENVRKILITVADLCLTSDRTSSLHGDADDCGQAACREFSARAFDEKDNTLRCEE